MIDENFFEGLNKIEFVTNTDIDTLQAIDNYSEKKVTTLCIIVCFISIVMMGLMMMI